MTGITKGPWHVDADHELWVSDYNGQPICMITAVAPTEEDRANAQAIALLPELIEALRDVVELASSWDEALDLEHGAPHTEDPQITRARNILAKLETTS